MHANVCILREHFQQREAGETEVGRHGTQIVHLRDAAGAQRVESLRRRENKIKDEDNTRQESIQTHIGLALRVVLMLHRLKGHGEIAGLGQLIGKHEHDALVQRGAERFDHLGRHKVAIDVGEGARIVDDATRIMGHR